jgi:hypothetical protein
MRLVLELPADLESELSTEAAQQGLPLAEFALRVLASRHNSNRLPKSGAEIVAYWQAEGLIGTRQDISDSQTHARNLREQAQKRSRP